MKRLNNWIESDATKALSIFEDDKSEFKEYFDNKTQSDIYKILKYSLQGTTQGNGLTGGLPPVRFSM